MRKSERAEAVRKLLGRLRHPCDDAEEAICDLLKELAEAFLEEAEAEAAAMERLANSLYSASDPSP